MKKKLSLTILLLIVIVSLINLVGCNQHTCVFEDWKEIKAATCIEKGIEKRSCECGITEEREIEINPNNHKPTLLPAKEPTYLETGLTEGSYCSDCNTIITQQQILDKISISALEYFYVEGYTNGNLTFHWKTAPEHINEFSEIDITVNSGISQDVYRVAKDLESWNLTISENSSKYIFSLSPVGEQGKFSTYVKEYFWKPEILEMNFPRMEITTEKGELPSCSSVSAPEGCFGVGATDANYVQSKISIYDENNNLLYLSSDTDFDVSKIKVRGNTSAILDKKPYKIKLDKKADLLAGLVQREMGVDYRNKNWNLLATGDSLNTAVGNSINSLVGMDWTPAYSYITLFLNGEYRGLYILVESIEQSEVRCDVSDDGYIIEMDAYHWNEDMYFETPISENSPLKYTFKHPDTDDFDQDSDIYNYIKNYMTELENALMSGGDVSSYLNLESFTKWLLIHDILASYDSAGSNIYLTKYDNTQNSKVHMGPTWDFDAIYYYGLGHEHLSRIRREGFFYFPELLKRQEFCILYETEFYRVKDSIMNEVQTILNEVNNETYKELLVIENERWFVEERMTQEEILTWFDNHITWMETTLFGND